MKFLLKVMFAPIMVALAIVVNVCSFALQLAGGILGIAASLVGIFVLFLAPSQYRYFHFANLNSSTAVL